MDSLFLIIDDFFKTNSLKELGMESACLQIVELYIQHLHEKKMTIPPEKLDTFISETIADIRHYIQVKSYGK